MKKIYIVLTHTGTLLSRIIKTYTKDEFSHVSIALDEELNKMYSFGRLFASNPFWGGFVHERINNGTFKRFKLTEAGVYSLVVTDEQYDNIVKTISKIRKNRKLYHFNIIGLLAVGFHKRIHTEYSFYCAEFVRYVLKEAGIEFSLPEIIKPEDFKTIESMKLIYKGKLKNYNNKRKTLAKNIVEASIRKTSFAK